MGYIWSLYRKPALVCGVGFGDYVPWGNCVVLETIFVCESDYLGHGILRIIK